MAKKTEASEQALRITDSIPESTWYWAALASIGLSAFLRLRGNAHWALFVGQWPPTFLLFGLYSRFMGKTK
jgi:hypothetical protein